MLDFSFLFTLDSIFSSEGFIVGYYVFTVAASLVLIKETKKRLFDLSKGIKSIIYAPISFGVLILYIVFAYPFVDKIPILNWSWLGYNIAFGPFAEEFVATSRPNIDRGRSLRNQLQPVLYFRP